MASKASATDAPAAAGGRGAPAAAGGSAPASGGAGGGRHKTNVYDLEKLVNARVRVCFIGGREVVGTLKGFDGLNNLVLDDTTEYLRDPADPHRQTGATRYLGLLVTRGTAMSVMCPEVGRTKIDNPFDEAEAEAEAS